MDDTQFISCKSDGLLENQDSVRETTLNSCNRQQDNIHIVQVMKLYHRYQIWKFISIFFKFYILNITSLIIYKMYYTTM